ncbi:uncharacterized protein At4g28440-like [Andrographis paniculata]|uniref:uncharacterized protein At4g28440-like n=1 Tax=Andrographis paniculata TaxID=175694 RepID=UPI0021E8127E|nr:uncharacterized protein At4g28440-like [Andrographis paniculata]
MSISCCEIVRNPRQWNIHVRRGPRCLQCALRRYAFTTKPLSFYVVVRHLRLFRFPKLLCFRKLIVAIFSAYIQDMADQKSQFTKVNQLRPSDTGFNLSVKVIDAKTVVQRGRSQGRFAECLVGDETGMIIFTARNDQVELAKKGNTLILGNAKIDMFKGSMRVAVDRSGRVEVGSGSFSVDESNNLSLIEFERIVCVV